MYKQNQCNKATWTGLAEKQRLSVGSFQFRPDMQNSLKLVMSYLAVHDVTGDVERASKKINMVESEFRGNHHGLWILRDAFKIAMGLPDDLRLYLQPLSSIPKGTFALQSNQVIPGAKENYIEFFGPCRSASSASLEDLGPVKIARARARANAHVRVERR